MTTKRYLTKKDVEDAIGKRFNNGQITVDISDINELIDVWTIIESNKMP